MMEFYHSALAVKKTNGDYSAREFPEIANGGLAASRAQYIALQRARKLIVVSGGSSRAPQLAQAHKEEAACIVQCCGHS